MIDLLQRGTPDQKWNCHTDPRFQLETLPPSLSVTSFFRPHPDPLSLRYNGHSWSETLMCQDGQENPTSSIFQRTSKFSFSLSKTENYLHRSNTFLYTLTFMTTSVKTFYIRRYLRCYTRCLKFLLKIF